MGFTSGSKVPADLIDEIADGLIATSSYWNDGDTTWDTSDRTESNARRCLKYTGDSDDIWIALEVVNENIYVGNYARGIRLSYSASWDEVNHAMPDDAYHTFCIIYAEHEGVHADLSTTMITYYLWMDSSGFALMGKPEPVSGDNYQNSFIIVTEHMGTKEYTDGLTNFYTFMVMNHFRDNEETNYKPFMMTRPFVYQGYDMGDGIMFWRDSIKDMNAMKSTGNGKVYYVKPVICNSTDNMTPIYQSEMFWKYVPKTGLVDGDVVAVDGETTKYLCKALTSPTSTYTLYYAIKYVA